MSKSKFWSAIASMCLPALLAMALTSAASHASTLLIVTDEERDVTAHKVKALLLSREPFASMPSFQIKIMHTGSKSLKCETTPFGALSCKSSIEEFADLHRAEKVLVIKVFPPRTRKLGGSVVCGRGSAMVAGAKPKVALHELGHSAACLADEYEFPTATAANNFCQEGKGAPNVVFLKEERAYGSDREAREQLAAKIPWFNQINAGAITHLHRGRLKLGTLEKNKIGLYPAPNCSRATNGVKAWRPSQSPNIMGDLKAELPPIAFAKIRDAFSGSVKLAASSPAPPADDRRALYAVHWEREGQVVEDRKDMDRPSGAPMAEGAASGGRSREASNAVGARLAELALARFGLSARSKGRANIAGWPAQAISCVVRRTPPGGLLLTSQPVQPDLAFIPARTHF